AWLVGAARRQVFEGWRAGSAPRRSVLAERRSAGLAHPLLARTRGRRVASRRPGKPTRGAAADLSGARGTEGPSVRGKPCRRDVCALARSGSTGGGTRAAPPRLRARLPTG